jgi:transposase
MQTPYRFRSKRQLWTYSGLGIETRDSAQYRFVRDSYNVRKKHSRFVVSIRITITR